MNHLQALFEGKLCSSVPLESNRSNSSDSITNTLLVFGPPNSGKTRFAIDATFKAMLHYCNSTSSLKSSSSRNNPYGPVYMSVQNRISADQYSSEIINKLGASFQSRPVGTLPALAFRIVSDFSLLNHNSSPRLINGAEQDSLLRSVVYEHILHVLRGESGNCDTCKLFKIYFNNSQWNTVVLNYDISNDNSSNSYSLNERNNNKNKTFISSAFIHELRDIIARLDELSIISDEDESRVLEELTNGDYSSLNTRDFVERLSVQWKLGFALRSSYRNMLHKEYGNSARYDASNLMVEASKAVKKLTEIKSGYAHIPSVVVVDDFQDVTLGGLNFLETLSSVGVRMVLTANPDESVQSFRGAYPDYVVEAARNGLMRAKSISIEDILSEDYSSSFVNSSTESAESSESPESCESTELTESSAFNNSTESSKNIVDNSTFVSKQIRSNPIDLESLSRNIDSSVSSLMFTDMPLSKRLWKLRTQENSVDSTNNLSKSSKSSKSSSYAYGSVYHSPREELDMIVWQIKRAHLDSNCKWSDIALIAHDNDTVRLFGERLLRDGVPVRYSSVKRTLSDEPFVQGLFAMIELAQLSLRGLDDISREISVGTLTLHELASYVRCRIIDFVNSPLVQNEYCEDSSESTFVAEHKNNCASSENANRNIYDVGISSYSSNNAIPANMSNVENVMRSIASLNSMMSLSSEKNSDYDSSPLRKIVDEFNLLKDKMCSNSSKDTENYVVDDRIIDETNQNSAENVENAANSANSAQDTPNTKDDSKTKDVNNSSNNVECVDLCYLLILCELCESLYDSDSLDNNSCVKDDININSDIDESESLNDEYCINNKAKRKITKISLLTLLHNMNPSSSHNMALIHACKLIYNLANSMKCNPTLVEPKYVLSQAWNICSVAEKWQIISLQNNDSGRIANSRLDAAMRLFSYAKAFNMAEQNTSSAIEYKPITGNLTGAINRFIEQVRGLEIQADSLARVAPLPDAVTLTTPAGSAGKRWKLVWIPQVQQNVWPNVEARNTMFGAESLVDMTINKRIAKMLNRPLSIDMKSSFGISVNSKTSVYTSEQRSFFVAITRAKSQLYVSAVRNDDLVPSDFLFRYMPSQFLSDDDGSALYTPIDHKLASIDTDARSLVCVARAQLMCAIKNCDKKKIDDALCALKLLKDHGVKAADFETWDFVNKHSDSSDSSDAPELSEELSLDSSSEDLTESLSNDSKLAKNVSCAKRIISLSPSKVDALWNCPVCAMLENEFSGPQKSSTSASFGTLIHNTACWASNEALLDTRYLRENYPQFIGRYDEKSEEDYVNAVKHIASTMRKYYEEIEKTSSVDENVRSRYMYLTNKRKVDKALYDIANYFVESASGSYSARNILKDDLGRVIGYENSEDKKSKGHYAAGYFGTLKRSYNECQLRATFGFEDIARIYYKTLGVDFNPRKSVDSNGNLCSNLTPEESKKLNSLRSIMGFLVGGWPTKNNEDILVRLSGRMDRMEVRYCANDNDAASGSAVSDSSTLTGSGVNLSNSAENGAENSSKNSSKNSSENSSENIESQITSESIRLIDYKTGIVPSEKEVFSDLQLVCYQLALHFFSSDCEFARATLLEYFDEKEVEEFLQSNNNHSKTKDSPIDKEMLNVLSLARKRNISGSMLFHVVNKNYPAESRNMAENMSQPALFAGDKLNTNKIDKRSGYASANRLYCLPDLYVDVKPIDVDESDWQDFINLGSQAQWSLMMISRVFFAASACLVKSFEREPEKEHIANCKCGTTCPSCSGKSDTVYEIRSAIEEAQKLNSELNSVINDVK